MSAMQGALSAAERSMRSVFVGNIPYEATEEQLKDIFSEVGPVLSFRLVYDRETGKPKGYGFCEYKDQDMALSAMRNLNGYELNGRALRVDNAASEKSKEELKNLQASLGGPPVESPYGPEVPGEQAPDAIAKVMSSLPPEQLYELMVQMKVCIENNPNEARILLMQNPQLSYALLQAEVIMKIVDPIQAKAMLHSQNPFSMAATALLPTPDVKPVTVQAQTTVPGINDVTPSFPPAMAHATLGSSPVVPNPASVSQRLPNNVPPSRPSLLGDRPAAPPNPIVSNQYPDRGVDPRALGDHDLRQIPMIDRDMRPPPLLGGDKDMRHQAIDEDFRGMGPGRLPDARYQNTPPNAQAISHGDIRNMPPNDMRNMPPGDMRNMRNMPPNDMHGMSPGDMRNMPSGDVHRMGQSQVRNMTPVDQHSISLSVGRSIEARNVVPPPVRGMTPIDSRSIPLNETGNRTLLDRPPVGSTFEGHRLPNSNRVEDIRNSAPMNPAGIGPRPPQNPRLSAVGNSSPAIGGASPNPAPSPRANNALAAAAAAIAPHDQEKAALIMQVLQLSDQQISMLPVEQRQSILILKEQIARSTSATS